MTKAATVDVRHGNEMNMRVARCYKERVSMKFLYTSIYSTYIIYIYIHEFFYALPILHIDCI